MQITTRSLWQCSWVFWAALSWLTPPASAVTVEWIAVEGQGNACEAHRTGFRTAGCFGAVGNAYEIAKYEVTNAQYAEFLNAKAVSDPLGLYSANMDPSAGSNGGIIRTGIAGSYTYTAVAGRQNMPVNHVSFYDALRFANWLENGQGNGDTETGSYTLLGGTPEPSNGATVTRNPGLRVFIASEDEWYKAAYYDTVTGAYFDYPASSDTPTTCTAPTVLANTSNCDADGSDLIDLDVDDLTAVGAFTVSASPESTFDQGGNVGEWTDTAVGASSRAWRGGSYNGLPINLSASDRRVAFPTTESSSLGFRMVLPEPHRALLLVTGVLAVTGLARRKFRAASASCAQRAEGERRPSGGRAKAIGWGSREAGRRA